MVNLGLLPGTVFSVANGVNGDGSIVVGRCGTGVTDRSFLWTPATGMVDLQNYLSTHGINLTGWTLKSANGISDDGLTIVGSGTHNGFDEGWVVVLPEPSTLGLLFMSCPLVVWDRARKSTKS